MEYTTPKEMSYAEEAVEKLSEATRLTEQEIVQVMANGFDTMFSGVVPDALLELIDELRATFNAY